MLSTWEHLINDLLHVQSVKIPRWYFPVNSQDIISYELHGFSDASMKAYAACVYLRCICFDGRTCSKLITAKSRITPFKILTIPC